MDNEIIPPELKGKNNDLDHSIELPSTEEAGFVFKSACTRMLTPSKWHQLCGPASAEFILTGDDGNEVHRLAREGDFFRIDIPGPGPSTGNGYDWVRVELLEDNTNPGKEEESCSMRLRASAAPRKEESDTAHFFKEAATSTFIIRRIRNKVIASYHGRNEIPNTVTGKASDNIRNAVVAMGAYAFLSELQWLALIKALLEKEKKDE